MPSSAATTFLTPGSFADGKVRALFSFKQVAYLRYHVREVGLINAIAREQAGLRDAEEDMRPGTWDEIRLPSGKHLLYEDQMIQLVRRRLRSGRTDAL